MDIFKKIENPNKNDLLNAGHLYLIENREEKALESYRKSVAKFDDPSEFWDGYNDDYQYLEQHGVARKDYFELIPFIKK